MMDLALQKPTGFPPTNNLNEAKFVPVAIKRKPGVVKMLFRDHEEKKVISYRPRMIVFPKEEGTNCGPEAISSRGERVRTITNSLQRM
jgi:hypothetical protein